MNLSNALRHAVFFKQKPLVLKKVLQGYFKGFILRQPVLRTVDFAVTNLCNSKCKMCSAHLLYKDSEKNILNPEEVVDVFLQASKLGAIHVNLTGGEPLLRNIDELCYIISHINPKKHLISMVTNSLLLDRKRLEKLKQAGLDTIQLSIESLDSEVNDEIRGVPGHLDKVMRALDIAKKEGLIVCLSTVLNHSNFDEVRNIIDFVERQEYKDIFVLINPVSASGELAGQTEIKLTAKDLEEYHKLLKIGFVRADTIVNFSGKSGCPAGKERIHITAYGDVITCPHVQISYGNVKKEPLKLIWKKMYNFSYLKKYSSECKHVFDEEYYDKLLKPIENIKKLPVSIQDHPVVGEEFRLNIK